jgi:hypothetical protein
MTTQNTMTPVQLGAMGEALAVDHLMRMGLRIVNRNWRCRYGELDVIACDETTRTLVFVEVKTLPRRACLRRSTVATTIPQRRAWPRYHRGVTTPRNDVHYVATEYGIVNLKGLSSTDRAIALIGLAHPNCRRRLTEAAQSMHLI